MQCTGTAARTSRPEMQMLAPKKKFWLENTDTATAIINSFQGGDIVEVANALNNLYEDLAGDVVGEVVDMLQVDDTEDAGWESNALDH
jgi:hypothetical protein